MSASDPILSAIEGVRTDLGKRIDDLGGRMDQMVTRREHEAEVRRLDQADEAMAERHASLVKSADTEHAELRKALEDDKAAREAERKRVDDQRHADRRFFLTSAIAAVGVAATLVGVIVSIFGN